MRVFYRNGYSKADPRTDCDRLDVSTLILADPRKRGPYGRGKALCHCFPRRLFEVYIPYVELFPVCEKSLTTNALEKFLSDDQTGGSVEELKTDEGMEFESLSQAIYERFYIQHELTPPDSPQFNAFAEAGISMSKSASLRLAVRRSTCFRSSPKCFPSRLRIYGRNRWTGRSQR